MAATGIPSLAQESFARADMRFGRVEFLIRTARGGDQAGLRVRDACGFRARLCIFYGWLCVSLVHADGTYSLTHAQSVGHTHTGLRAVLCGHVSHVEKKCDVGRSAGILNESKLISKLQVSQHHMLPQS